MNGLIDFFQKSECILAVLPNLPRVGMPEYAHIVSETLLLFILYPLRANI